MKKQLFNFILLSFFIAGCTADRTNHSPDNNHAAQRHSSANQYVIIMDEMMNKMHTGVNDKRCVYTNFLTSMIPHHQAAIDMSEYEIKHGKSKEMITLAHQIITEQRTEIQEMELLLKEYHSCPKTDQVTSAYIKAMDKTMTDMMKNTPMLNHISNVDRDFAWMMIPHHQAAIDMSLVLLNYSQNPQIRLLAENIIASQQVEIKQMEDFLAKK